MTNATASEIAAIAARKHRPWAFVTINGLRVMGVRCRIRHGFGLPTEGGGNVVATCDLELVTRPPWLAFRQRVEVDLGWVAGSNMVRRRRFTGYVEDDGAAAWPQRRTIKAVGFLRWAESKTPIAITYATAPGGAGTRSMIIALLASAGVTDVDIQGDDTTLGTVEDVSLAARQSYLSLVQQIDHPHLDVTFDWLPSGKVRRATITALPAASPVWSYEYPGEVVEIDNPTTIREVRNRVEVIGLDEATATRRADSPYVRSGYDEIQEVSNDLIESDIEAAEVALLWMPSVNRITRRVRGRVPGNPLLQGGDTIEFTALGLSVPIDHEMLWLGEIDEEYSGRGYWMWLTLYGGAGQSGYPVYVPYADFTFKIVVEKFDMGGGAGTYYIVYCDGSASSSPDGSALTYAWSNDQTVATSTAITYTFVLTEAELDAPCVVTLVVTNASAETDTATISLPAHDSGDIEGRLMYLAKETDADATPDSGVTWNTVTDNAICTPEIAGETHSYFGVGSTLVYTGDFLATATVLIHTFTAGVNCIWINEVNADKVAVGLADGAVWTTNNASALAASIWTKAYQFGLAVNWIIWSWDNVIWACMGMQIIASGVVQWQLDAGYTAKRLALSFFAHYAAGDDGAGNVQVKRNDGFPLTFGGGAPARLGGLTHHILEDILYAADEAGKFYRKAPGSTELTFIATIGGDECFHLLRDGTEPLILWASCASGLYKTFDGGYNWYLERAGKTLMAGYGSSPWAVTVPVSLLSTIGEGTVLGIGVQTLPTTGGGEPANWKDVTFDDSGWAAPVWSGSNGNPIPYAGTDNVDVKTHDQAGNESPNGDVDLHRRTFVLTGSVVTTATLKIRANGYLDAWINGVFVGQAHIYATGDLFYNQLEVSVPLTVFLTDGATNVLAVRNQNDVGWGHGITYDLEVS
jgi:hypothetical protein